MQDPQKLQEENERLIAELAIYKEAEKVRKQKKGRFIKRLGSFGSWFFLGGDFKASIKKLVVEVRDKDKQLSNDTLGDVLAHGAWRFTRIGCFAVLMAFIPLAILGVQTTLLYFQNDKIDAQNELFKFQNDKVTEQTDLMQSQNTLLATQNEFFKKQLGQIDTQNELFKLQNDKVAEQTTLLFKQNDLLATQNSFVKYQSIQIDTQIQQASIQNKLVTAQNIRLDQQTHLQEAERRSSLVFLFSNIMDAIDKELSQDYNTDSIRNLSPQLIGRIIAISTRLKPYKYLEGNTLIDRPLSPERGQLLISLIESKLEPSTYHSIFVKANFNYADLANANLANANLKEINLAEANLVEANLREANLMGANLMGTNLASANLKLADLKGINLIEANLAAADLSQSTLNMGTLAFANLEKANLMGASLVQVNLTKARLIAANLERVDLSESDLAMADLGSSDLRNIKLTTTTPLTLDNWKLYHFLSQKQQRCYNIIASKYNDTELRDELLRFLNETGSKPPNLTGAKTHSLDFLTELKHLKEINHLELLKLYYVDSTKQIDFFERKKPYYIIKRK